MQPQGGQSNAGAVRYSQLSDMFDASRVVRFLRTILAENLQVLNWTGRLRPLRAWRRSNDLMARYNSK